jgi:hypothetical protein
MARNYHALPKDRTMQEAPLPMPQPNSSTSASAAGAQSQPVSPVDAYDVAIGCECADPSLQIESWAADCAAQPLREFH